ncbi:MAG: glucosamine-6-phosphate deaminase, partial [bacterium]
MEIIAKSNYTDMSLTTAALIADCIREKSDAVLGFIAGSTPIGTYKELIRLCKDDGLDFSKVVAFNIDEYYGLQMDLQLPYEKDQSYERFMWEELFKHINIKQENINMPKCVNCIAEESCRQFENSIKKSGGIDIQLLGIGLNGHIGFNEPGSAFDSRTRLVPLDQRTIDSNYNKFYKKSGISKDKMPHSSITAGIGT